MISHEPLAAPIVSDFMGFLYNKAAILQYLLPSDDPDAEKLKADQAKLLDGRVKSMKDVVELNFETDSQGEPKGRWVCPVSNKELGPAVHASYIVPCGHVFADVALKAVSDEKCLQCNEPFKSENTVNVLPVKAADKDRLRERMEALREQGLTHSLKKASSKKRKGRTTVEQDVDGIALAGEAKGATTKAKSKHERDGPGPKASINNASTASLTAKVLAEEEAKAKRRKLDSNDNLKTLFSKGSTQASTKNRDFMTRGFEIPAGAKR